MLHMFKKKDPGKWMQSSPHTALTTKSTQSLQLLVLLHIMYIISIELIYFI